MLILDPHPLLDLRAFVAEFPRPLGEMTSPAELVAMLALDAPVPMRSDDHVRETVRQLLRHGGFKPTGRSKPASEYPTTQDGQQAPEVAELVMVEGHAAIR